MSGVTTEQLARLQAQLNKYANEPGEPGANRENLDESPTAPSVRSSSSWVYGKSGLSSPNASVDGEDPRGSRNPCAYPDSRGMPTPAHTLEHEELLKRNNERTLLRDTATASIGSINEVPVTSLTRAQSHTGRPRNQGADWAAHMWPLTREQRIEAYHRACREEPGYARLASPYYSVEQRSPTLKRPIDDSTSPKPKRRKPISEDKSEDDDVHATGMDANMPNLRSGETDPLGDAPSASSQYAIAREVRKRSKPSVRSLTDLGLPKVPQSRGLARLQQPDTKPFLHNPHDLWRPDSIGKTHKAYYEPRTKEEQFNAWLEADRERCELQELQLKEVQEQMRRDSGYASWKDLGSNEGELHDSAPQVDEMDNLSEKSSPANSIGSMNSDSRSSTTTVSSDGDSPDRKKRKASIGVATVPTASQTDNAPHESPVPAPEIRDKMHPEKPQDGLDAQGTQDASRELAPAQVPQAETTDSRTVNGSETMDLSNRSTQGPHMSLSTRKDTAPGMILVDADLVDGLQQDKPKDLQLCESSEMQDIPKDPQFSESSKVSQVPPADDRSNVAHEDQAKETPRNNKKQRTPKTPHQGRKNQKTPLGPTPSKIQKPSARLTRSKAKTNHSTKFEKLDNAGKLPVDWTA